MNIYDITVKNNKNDSLKLENQMCFPLYAASNLIIRKYKPVLDKIDLTYTQYITMLALWENKSINVKELGKKLFLDSGTLTPLLKKLEQKGYIKRERSKEDERNLIINITESGKKLRDQALIVPKEVSKCVNLSPKEAISLYSILYKILDNEEN